jgi:hypothetical protein
VSVVATVAALSTAIITVGTTGLLSAAGLARWTPRFSLFATPRAVREHRSAR